MGGKRHRLFARLGSLLAQQRRSKERLQRSEERFRVAFEQAEAARRQLDEQLRQAQKMEILGELAGGIAHDFNNILGSILGYADLALRRLRAADDHKLASHLREIVTAGERGRALVDKLLAFARRQPRHPAPDIFPAPVMREAISMLAATTPGSIAISASIEDESSRIRIDPIDLNQILLNLAVNARHAVGERGHIRFRLFRASQTASSCTACKALIASGNFVGLEVSDDGCGIAPERLSRIFEPFFTTRPAGMGSGLGLSVVRDILLSAGGHVVVESAPGQGTTFRIVFPPVDAPPSATGPTRGVSVSGAS